jgi:hypothetical protein
VEQLHALIAGEKPAVAKPLGRPLKPMALKWLSAVEKAVGARDDAQWRANLAHLPAADQAKLEANLLRLQAEIQACLAALP